MVLRLSNLMAGFSPRTSGFTPSAVHARFAVERLFNGFLSDDFRFSSSVIIPTVFHIHSCVVRRMDNVATRSCTSRTLLNHCRELKQYRQCTYHVKPRGLRLTIVAVWVCTLVIQHAILMRHTVLSSMTSLAPPYFITLSHKRYDFLDKIIAHKMCVLIFFASFSENFLILKNWERY